MLKYIEVILLLSMGCSSCFGQNIPSGIPFAIVKPRIVTEQVKMDTDDPAIWIHPQDRRKSLVIGTDKHTDGAIYAFDLEGKIVKRVGGIKRPNNVDIAYGFPMNGKKVDIAVFTEREEQRLRVFSLPDLIPLDGGDLMIFNGDKSRAPMGIAIYKRPKDNVFFAFVSGKSGPPDGYIGQYRLDCDISGKMKMKLVREFGHYSGVKEIESIAVDAELERVYYSDEKVGVREYQADPDAKNANKELSLFADQGFVSDHEGISIYKLNKKTGYILVSDQQANRFWIFERQGSGTNPYSHRLVKIIKVATEESDGSEVTNLSLSYEFRSGLFVAMSNGKTFHYYAWEDIAGNDLKKSQY
jgi:3-phytase